MIELVQLEKRYADFAAKNIRVVVVSMEGLEEARLTQADCPHLTVLADEGRGLSDAIALVHAKAGPQGQDIDMPTTILVDRGGTVRWLFRPGEVITRLSPDELLKAVDQNLPHGQ